MGWRDAPQQKITLKITYPQKDKIILKKIEILFFLFFNFCHRGFYLKNLFGENNWQKIEKSQMALNISPMKKLNKKDQKYF